MIFDGKVLRKAIRFYGKINQTMMLFEEMAELQKEVCKTNRGKNNVLEIIGELADIYIMLEQLKMMYRIKDEDVQAHIKAKTNRLDKRMEEGTDE